MEHSKDIADALSTLIKLMVDHPDGVSVECIPIADGNSLRIAVDRADNWEGDRKAGTHSEVPADTGDRDGDGQ